MLLVIIFSGGLWRTYKSTGKVSKFLLSVNTDGHEYLKAAVKIERCQTYVGRTTHRNSSVLNLSNGWLSEVSQTEISEGLISCQRKATKCRICGTDDIKIRVLSLTYRSTLKAANILV